jgi:hypothetical protein
MVAMVMGTLTFLVHAVANTRTDRDEVTRRALIEARQALIGFAVTASQGPGHLPCPDMDNDGDSDGAACNLPAVGRLPWRTLDIGDLRDGSGEQLWYAVSPDFINTNGNPVNSDTPGQFTISGTDPGTGKTEVIAIVFAPGGLIPGQRRDDDNEVNAANYLEGANSDATINAFEALPASSAFNDQLLPIQAADLFPAVEAIVISKMESEVSVMLDEYRKRWKNELGGDGFLPYPAPFSNITLSNNSYCGQVNTSATALKGGLLPVSKAASCVADHGTLAKVENAIASGPVTCARATGGDTIMILRCNFTYDSTGFSDPPRFLVETEITGITQSLALPIDKDSITPVGHDGVSHLAQTLNGDRLKVVYSQNLAPTTTNTEMTISIPVYFAPDRLKNVVDATWFFDNNWQRVVYYAASPEVMAFSGEAACTTLCLSIIDGPDTAEDRDAVLVLAGMRVLGRARPSDVLSNYFEGRNTLDAAQFEFETYRRSRERNDKVAGIPRPTP